ncbi:MAG: hypothetical protein WA140_11400 [Geobacteraceae bacterium]
MKLKFNKIIGLSLVAIIVCLSVNTVFSVAHEIEEAGFAVPHNIKIGFLHVETSDHCPVCPTDNHPNTDHDHVSCDHHNYTSLADRISHLEPATISTSLAFFEPFKAIPEVYLDKFIPPQNLA